MISLNWSSFFTPCRDPTSTKIVVSRHGVKNEDQFKEIIALNFSDGKNFFFFDSHPAQKQFLDMFAIYCYMCSQAKSARRNSKEIQHFSDFSSLEKHMQAIHGMVYCNVCLENHKTFPSQRRVYKPRNIKLHMLRG